MGLPFTKKSISIRHNVVWNNLSGAGRHTDSIYNYNNLGYRSNDDFIEHDISKKIMFFGCSITEGIGVEYERTWPVLVTNAISQKNGKYKNYNMSYHGCSAEFISRMVYQTIDLYIPDLVIILWPSTDRREYFTTIHNSIKVWQGEHQTESKKLMYNELRNPIDDFYNSLRQILFVDMLLEYKNIKRIHSTWSSDFSLMKEHMESLCWIDYNIGKTWWSSPKASDNIHPGEIAHYIFSKIVLNKIDELHLL